VTETLANLTRYVDAEIYLSGPGGKDYLEVSSDPNINKDSHEEHKQYIKSFDGYPVEVVFQNYEHPVYPQRFPGFVPYMSSIDMLFNLGYLPHSGEKIKLRAATSP
jgi:hypothetical protein